MKGIKILLAPKWEHAKNLKADITIEAEYGLKVLQGSLITLAHHTGEYKKHPAPCNNPNTPRLEKGVIVTSHLDWDVIGAIAEVVGEKPYNPQFWSSVEYIDLHGPQNVWNIPLHHKEMMEAYWAWCFYERTSPKFKALTDVTELVKKHIRIVKCIMAGDATLIERGREWSKEVNGKVESCLRYEDEYIRAFVTENVFCSAGYYSPAKRKLVPLTVVFHSRKKQIRIANSDGTINCERIAQRLWGTEAGGKEGIAGSPKGMIMNERDFYNALNYLNTINLLKIA